MNFYGWFINSTSSVCTFDSLAWIPIRPALLSHLRPVPGRSLTATEAVRLVWVTCERAVPRGSPRGRGHSDLTLVTRAPLLGIVPPRHAVLLHFFLAFKMNILKYFTSFFFSPLFFLRCGTPCLYSSIIAAWRDYDNCVFTLRWTILITALNYRERWNGLKCKQKEHKRKGNYSGQLGCLGPRSIYIIFRNEILCSDVAVWDSSDWLRQPQTAISSSSPHWSSRLVAATRTPLPSLETGLPSAPLSAHLPVLSPLFFLSCYVGTVTTYLVLTATNSPLDLSHRRSQQVFPGSSFGLDDDVPSPGGSLSRNPGAFLDHKRNLEV